MNAEQICGKRKSNKPKPGTFEHLSTEEMRTLLKNVPNVNKLDRLELCRLLMNKKESPVEISTSNSSEDIKLIPTVIANKIAKKPKYKMIKPKKVEVIELVKPKPKKVDVI